MHSKSRSPFVRRLILCGFAIAFLPIIAGCGGGNLCCSGSGTEGSVDVDIRSAKTNDSAPSAVTQTGEQR